MKVDGITSASAMQRAKTAIKNTAHKVGKHFKDNGDVYLGVAGLTGLVTLEAAAFSKLSPETLPDGTMISGVTGLPYPKEFNVTVEPPIDIDIAPEPSGLESFLEEALNNA